MKKLILLSFATTFALSDSLFYTNLEKSWNIIKLQEAYNENPAMNGQGLSIGVIDSVFNTSHPSLSGKDKGLSNNDFDFKGYISDKKYDSARHGSHVVGIILGSYADTSTEKNPHGIAYGASYYGVGLLNDKQQYNGNLFDEFKDKDIKIINNSWEKQGFYPLINRYFKFAYGYTGIDGQSTASISSDVFFNRILNNNINNTNMKEVRELIELSKQKGILNITAAGNDGSLSSGVLASVPSYDESVRAWLVVGALDAANVEEKDGKFTIKTSVSSGDKFKDYYASGVAYFSNLFRGNALYALMAPGFNIDSADALFQYPKVQTNGNKFTEMSGTSQAAPFVSGAALLVQQKFPFLKGAQIADVLLSTANSTVSFEKELLVQSYNGGAFYNVIYIDKDPPKTSNGKIDKEQVKKDLQTLGYSEDGANKILATLYKTQDAVNNNQINDAEAIVRLNKEEIIGQGILDVQKALKGLAKLDANRLNSSDIQNFENEKQAFYTIDTAGFSGEFSHNIEQRLWDDKWHIQDALNLPKDMKDISKVGLSKSGLGTLTLSGKNTYEGATKVSQGVLKLAASGELNGDIAALNEGSFELEGKAKKNAYALQKGRLNIQSGASVEGDIYAKELGRVILNGGSIKNASVDNAFFEFKTGTMMGNFLAQNKALLQIPQNAEISGKTTAKSGAIIQLGAVENGINTSTASLSTKEVELLDGGILAGSGTLKDSSNSFKLQNTSGVVMAGFGAEKITSLQKNELQIQGSYTQGSTASLQIAFNGGQNSTNNSKITATNYDIKGGELLFVPIYSGGDSRLSAGLSVKLDLGKLNDEVDNFTQIRTQDSNTLIFSYDKSTQLLSAKLKDNAYASGDKQVSAVLGQIASSKNLPQKYEDYFGMLDLADRQIYNESLESLAENATLNKADNSLNHQANLALNNLVFLLEPSNLNTLNASNNYLLAGLDGDLNELVLNEILKEFSRENKDEIVLNAKYKYFKRKSFNSDTYASNIAMKRYVNDSLLLGTFMDFAYTNSNNKHTQNDNKTLSFALNALYDLEYFGLLSSASLGFGFNDTSRNFLMPSGTTTKLNGTYNDVLLSLQGGIYKDIWLNDFLLKPMALLNFSGIFQEGFRERGALFAKSYDKATYHNIGSSLGLYSGIRKELTNSSLYFGIFNFYNVKFKDNLKNQAHFSDFDNFSFSQKLKTNKHSILSGINAQWQYKKTSAKLELGYEKGGDYQSTGVSLSVGYSF